MIEIVTQEVYDLEYQDAVRLAFSLIESGYRVRMSNQGNTFFNSGRYMVIGEQYKNTELGVNLDGIGPE